MVMALLEDRIITSPVKNADEAQEPLSGSNPNPPPELTNFVGNSYNAKDGNFLSRPIFALTYNQGRTVTWGPTREIRDIPDQISASISTAHSEVRTSLLMESRADYDRSFSASVGAEYSGVTYSGSAQSNLLYHGSLFSSVSSFYALNFYLQTVLIFERIDLALDDNFRAALNALPLDISSSDNQQRYFDFFEAYGTHYAKSGTMGGTIVMETDIQDSVLETASQTEVAAAISVGYDAIVTSGKLDVNTAYTQSDFLNKHRSSIAISLNVLGGTYASGEAIIDWVNSIYNTPSLVLTVPSAMRPLTTLESIANLVGIAGGNPQIAANIISLVHNYVMQSTLDDGSLLSSPVPIDFSIVYDTTGNSVEAGDGFVVGLIEPSAEGDRGSIQAYDDFNGDPTVLRAVASQHLFTKDDDIIPYASLTMPTPHGTHFTAQKIPTAGMPTTSLQFIGFGNVGEEGMGSWQEIAIGSDLVASSDGFVVAYVDWNGVNGARGYVQGLQNNQVVAGASQHYFTKSDIIVPGNSFCMPICKGTAYKVTFTATALNPRAQAYFVPLSEAYLFFDSFQTRTENRVYQAPTDGFLLAYLFAQTNGDRGFVHLYSHADQSELVRLGKLASTSIHYFTNDDIFVPYNSAMIPVSRNNFFTANFTATARNAGIHLLWMPLGAK
jgi:hypothetical protein